MFHQKENRKFLKIGIVLLIALTAFVASGQVPALTPQIQEEKIATANKTFNEALTLVQQGTAESYRAAREKFRTVADLFATAGKKQEQAVSLVFVGRISNNLGEKQKALEHYNQAIHIYRSLDDKSGEASMLGLLGLFYSSVSEYQKSLDLFNQALTVYRVIGDKDGESKALAGIGLAYMSLNEYQKSLENYNNALILVHSLGSKEGEAALVISIGLVYSILGENQKALDSYQKALQIFTAIENKQGVASALFTIGKAYSDFDDNQKALEYYNRALSFFRVIGNKSEEAIILNNIGFLHIALDKYQESLKYFTQSLPIFRAVQDKRGEALTYNNLGYVYLLLGEKTKTLENLNRALSISKTIGDKNSEAYALSNFADFWYKQKNLRLAVFYGKQEINIIQSLRSNIRGLDKETQKTYLKKFEKGYLGLADVLVELGRFAEAQQVLALLKEEEYFDYVRRDADEIKNLKGNIKLKPDEQKLIERYNLLANKVTEIGAEFQRLDDKKRKLVEGVSLPEAEQKRYEELTAQLNDANAAFKLFLEKELIAELGKPVKKEIDIDRALQEKLRSWGEGTVALYTIAGEDRYRVILTTPTVQVDGKTEIKSADLNKKIFAFRAALQNPAIDPRPLGKELYDILVMPIEKDLQAANAKTLIWSLDGTLRYIPLAALSPDGKTYLVEKYQTALITSTTRQSLMAENEKDWHTLGLGVSTEQTVPDPILPDEKITFSALPGVKTELATIVKDEQTPNEKGLLAGKRLIDADFNPKNFGDSLTKETPEGKRKYTIVHIASHFRLSDNSANSFLLLGGGNTLTLEQISNSPQMRFGNVELVTLSACNTAFGSDSTGKEVDSLATFIELRGAKAIIATLWSVSDDSTQLLMSEFYRLHKENPTLTKAKAMQKAQTEMIEGKLKSNGKGAGCRAEIIGQKNGNTSFKCDTNAPYSHPFYWSPFVLIGNWR